MSTRQESSKRLLIGPAQVDQARFDRLAPADALALVACSRRQLLLATHRRRLPREDLEDCYSQATLELFARASRGGTFAGPVHMANALEQRFLSRIRDRRRAVSGRSPMEAAIASALPISGADSSGVEVADMRADVERLTFLREDLRLIAQIGHRLTPDQRLVLRSQLSSQTGCSEFCKAHGWSAEKYRKVAQRARTRLTQLLAPQDAFGAGEQAAEPCPAPSGRSD